MTGSRSRLAAWTAGVVALAAVSVGCGAGDEAPSDFCKAVAVAESESSSEVDAVESAARGLSDSVAAAAKPNPDTVLAARTAVSSFTTAVDDLGKAVSESC